MQQSLKLTITAVGEAGSVFMQPCDPITLHESEIDDAQAEPEVETDAQAVAEDNATADETVDAVAEDKADDDQPAIPHRLAS